MPRWAGWALEALFWWAACLGIWLISLASVPAPQLYIAVAASCPCGVAAVGGRMVARNAWRFRARWAVPALRLPLAIVSDTAQLLWSRRPGDMRAGGFSRVAFEDAEGTTSLPEGRRALATWLVCVTPGTLVGDFNPEDGSALVHSVPTKGPSILGAVVRAE